MSSAVEAVGFRDETKGDESWRIFDADEEVVTEEPVNASAARFEFDRTCKLNPDGRFELHGRVGGGEWEVVC